MRDRVICEHSQQDSAHSAADSDTLLAPLFRDVRPQIKNFGLQITKNYGTEVRRGMKFQKWELGGLAQLVGLGCPLVEKIRIGSQVGSSTIILMRAVRSTAQR
jgi:hypothetical protein